MMRWVLAGVAVIFFAGCANFHPMHPQQWPVKYDPVFNPVVQMQSGYVFGKQARNGVIVHSSEALGTYVLTTLEAIVAGDPKVMAYDYSHEARPNASMGIYYVEIKAKDPERDLVLLKLHTKLLFKPARFHRDMADPHFYEKRLSVHMVSISPERYPHFEEVRIAPEGSWRIEYIEGASGSPIFCEGLMIGLYSEDRWQRAIPVREIREFLDEQGFTFIE